jgi:hypothetical protein
MAGYNQHVLKEWKCINFAEQKLFLDVLKTKKLEDKSFFFVHANLIV